MTKLKFFRLSATVLVALIAGFAGAGDATTDLRITALGNEGFLVEAGGRVVIVDGLYVGLPGYLAPTEEQRAARERAMPPFDAVDLVLATHHHPDHFDADVVARHLKANPRAILITTPNAVDLISGNGNEREEIADRLRGVNPQEGESVHLEVENIEVEVLNLHHGSYRKPPVTNLGFVVRVGGVSFLHMGDTEATAEEIKTLNLNERHIDLAFVPYWHLLERHSAQSYLEAIGAGTVVAMHIPTDDAPLSYLDPASDLQELIRLIEDAVPGVVIPKQVMDTLVFSAGAS
jgi:L-ascorbate metabolism protein UlaG (beta-lactamase superfamily)